MLVDATGQSARSSILDFARQFGETTGEIIMKSAGLTVPFSGTAQYVPFPRLSGDVACFVTFHGDYSGMLVLNFDGASALELTHAILARAGMTRNELPSHWASENARGAIGELTNQIVGHARQAIQRRWDLSADANIPVVVPLQGLRGLEMHAGGWGEEQCIRLGFRTPGQKRFHLELALEAASPVSLPALPPLPGSR
jgi:CheY-specific phosphatase CheX